MTLYKNIAWRFLSFNSLVPFLKEFTTKVNTQKHFQFGAKYNLFYIHAMLQFLHHTFLYAIYSLLYFVRFVFLHVHVLRWFEVVRNEQSKYP